MENKQPHLKRLSTTTQIKNFLNVSNDILASIGEGEQVLTKKDRDLLQQYKEERNQSIKKK